MEELKSFLKLNWSRLVLVGTPVVFAMLPLLANSTEASCAYVIIVMAVYWMTDVVPLPVTALIPVFMFPMLGILSTNETCQEYFRGTIMMFLGGLTVAVAVEHSNLHKRIALFVILKVGQSPRRLMFGFMSTTTFLSMWISNTAAAAMMVPIVDALLEEICKDSNSSRSRRSSSVHMEVEISSSKMKAHELKAVGNHYIYDNQALEIDEPDRKSTNGTIGSIPDDRKSTNGTIGSIPDDRKSTNGTIGSIPDDRKSTNGTIASIHDDDQEVDDNGNASNFNIEIETASVRSVPRSLARTVSNASSHVRRRPPADPTDPKTAVSTMFMLGTAYAANIGGTAFPTGTGPNLVLWGLLQSSFEEPTSINFATWMAFNIPVMILCVAITGVILDFMFIGWGKNRKIPPSTPEKERVIKEIVQLSYDKLGSITFHEMVVLILFTTLVLLWIFRSPGFITGWAVLFSSQNYIGNATPAILIVFFLFVIPAKPTFFPFGSGATKDSKDSPGCLTWDAVEKGVPWGLILLMGGGFAMAKGAASSGLSAWLGEQLRYFDVLPHIVIVIFIVLAATFLTEVVSNMTTANIFLPVVRDLAINIKMNPVFLMLPTTVACSYALMMPVSNPPNAIAYNACTMSTTDMMKAGVVVKLVCITVLLIFLVTIGEPIFGLYSFPDWANSVPDIRV